MNPVIIGNTPVGDGLPCFILSENGINHNGSLDLAFQLIDAAKESGASAVKFQKRSVDLCYTKEELDKPRESPWGTTTRQQKEGLEFGHHEYEAIDRHCRMMDTPWFASCWDGPSVAFIEQFNTQCYKIASASITDRDLLTATCETGKPILLSTGMSTIEEIDAAVAFIRSFGNPLILMHCTSTYPSKTEELNLRCIPMLRERYGCLVGYSGHEVGLQTTVAAVALGACVVERHLTLDRSSYGSDQSASVEPHGFKEMVRDIRVVEAAMGDGTKRVFDSELPVKAKLRKVETLLANG